MIDIVAAAEAAQDPVEGEALAPPGWAVRSTADVNFAFSCKQESEAEIASIDAQLADLIALATARADSIKAKHQSRAAFFTARLVDYVEAHKGELLIGKKRSHEFLGGTVAWRKKPAKVVVTDKEALVSWLTENGDPALMRVTVAPDLKAIDASIQASGVLPPGLDLEPESETLTVTATALPTINGTPHKEIKA